jgi:bisphosphoglycerate-independent phosphoglycerate mutase (AlkP superfamily)
MVDVPIPRPVVLVILDGFGWRDATADNAIRLADTPQYDALWQHGPRGFLRACGAEVGLPGGQAGDSETGHRNIGAGRIVWKGAPMAAADTLGGVIAASGRRQLRIATAARFRHVTQYVDGAESEPRPGEARIVATDLAVEAVRAIAGGRYDFILINIGDADLAGHTGDLAQAIAAVEAVDATLGRIAEAVRAAGGALLATSDHGNCELMRDPATGGPHAGHTANDVPVLLMAPGDYFFRDGRLADVAPTLLKLMGLAPPPAMTGRPLLRSNLEGWDPQRSGAAAPVPYVAWD